MLKKNISFVIILGILLTACTSTKKLIEKGDNDKAIGILIQKLKKNPDDQKSIALLTEAYTKANSNNESNIKQLRASGQPDIWFAVFKNYLALEQRQDHIKSLPPGVLKVINFKTKNYQTYLDNARQKAAVYLYAHAKKLLDEGSKKDAQQAYQEFKKITTLYKDYKNVDELMRNALVKGTRNIEYEVRNHSASLLPDFVFSVLQNIDLGSLDEEFLQFHNYPQKGVDYDHKIRLTLSSVKLTPDKRAADYFTETRKIQAGWIEKKDSTGKLIKLPKFEEVSCDVTVVQQYKAAKIRAYLDFVDNASEKVLIKVPLEVESIFKNKYATASGNSKACSMEVHSLLNNSQLIYPSDDDLIMDAARKLNRQLKQLIWQDEDYLKE